MNISVDVTAIVYSALFLNFFLVASFDNLGPRLAKSHAISVQELSIIISLKSFVNMLCGPLLAILSSKFPAAFLFSTGGFCLTASMTAVALSTDTTGFMIARALHGIGTSGLMVGGMAVLMRCVPKKHRGRYSSIAYSAAGHAPLVSPVLSGLMYDKLGQMWTFLIPAMAAFLASAVSFVTLRRVLAVPRLDSSESSISTIEKSMIWTCVKRMFSHPMTYVAIAGIFSDGLSFGSCESTLPVILAEWDDSSLSVLTSSLIYSVGPLTFTIIAPIAGFLVDKLTPSRVVLIGLSLFTILFPFFQFFERSLVGVGASLAIAFGSAAFCEVAIFSFVAEIAESTQIRHADTIAYALNELIIQAGYAIGNIVGRELVDWNGFLAMGCFIAGWDGLAVIASVAILASFKKQQRKLEKKVSDASSEIAVASDEYPVQTVVM